MLAFAEACLGIGLFVSGAFLVIVATALYSNDIASLGIIVPLAMVGALCGDHVGFYVGRYLGPRFNQSRIAMRHQHRLLRAEQMIRRHGPWVVFIGRFLPAIRSLIPAALGISGFERLRFTLLDLLACALWSAALGAIVVGLDAGLFS